MGPESSEYRLGPGSARLTVRTTKAGAASKAGHNLLIEVGSWDATFAPDSEQVTVSVDSRSLRVIEGTGGLKGLTDEDRANIAQTIDDEVLCGCAIEFRSTEVKAAGEQLYVVGDLELAGQRHPVAFTLSRGQDGRLSGSATVKQTDWGMKPYSALFGTLKVGDEVSVAFDGQLPA